MPTYKTPGVYVEEISTLPPSVAEVSTAIPAFIGYTEKAERDYVDLTNKPTRISTMLDYEEMFGNAPNHFQLTMEGSGADISITDPVLKYLMCYAVDMYFKNGGGPCYIVSVGEYEDPQKLEKTKIIEGLKALKAEDEPTLILFPDAVNLDETDYHGVCKEALGQCGELKDRFAIFDVKKKKTDAAGAFRTGIGTNYLMYGAAYYPYLQTTLNYHYEESGVTIGSSPAEVNIPDENGIKVSYSGSGSATVKVTVTSGAALSTPVSGSTLTIDVPQAGKTPTDIVAKWEAKSTSDKGDFKIERANANSDVSNDSKIDAIATKSLDSGGSSSTLDTLATTKPDLYNQVKAALAKKRIVLPPSSAIAGVYAMVDRDRGVWKAPANVSLSGVIAPTVELTGAQQGELNVHTTGKSINAIRSFTGKGTLVWGARTLAGNSNEWRYISVRRLFNMIEESIQKSTAFAVFEPNDDMTWLKVRAMIESYLDGLWRQGALAGPAPEQAYFVNVGLGKSMTQQDILEGRLNIDVGIAAVRPAEFIILKFSHKLQEA